MKTLLIRAFAVFIAVALMASGVFAAAKDTAVSNLPADDTVWQIETSARILKADDAAVWVYILSPNSLKISESDHVRPAQRLTLTKNTTLTDGDNGAIGAEKLVPGQEVRVKFTYRFVGSSRIASPIECKNIAVQGALLTAGSTVKISGLKDNTMIASILEIDGDRAEVFVEGGKMLYGSDAYDVVGRADIKNIKSAEVRDVSGRKLPYTALKKHDRVIISTENDEWMETYPPQYAGGDAVTIRILGAGENVIVPE